MVCRLYAFPTEKRFRVAQMLIMPPFQKQGLGREMLTAVNKVQILTYFLLAQIVHGFSCLVRWDNLGGSQRTKMQGEKHCYRSVM